MTNVDRQAVWPALPYEAWHDTLDTLHMWLQIVGKVKLELCPFLNQWWEVTLAVTPSGMTTRHIPYANGKEAFDVAFNFLTHTLQITTSQGVVTSSMLKPQSVAAFYKAFMDRLASLGITVSIWPEPVEFSDPIPFPQDTKHRSYDPVFVTKWWRILLSTALIFDEFRTTFRGKSSPIQFFWGSFDLNGTRFSGKKVTPPKKKGVMGRIMKYAENEENFAFGFWPGDARLPYPAFFSYVYPTPSGVASLDFGKDVSFNEQLGECILPYEAVRTSSNPEKTILNFLSKTYTASANLAGWPLRELSGPAPL